MKIFIANLFKGRLRRFDYFILSFLFPIMFLILFITFLSVVKFFLQDFYKIFIYAIAFPYLAILLLVYFSGAIRRCHDMNMTGFWSVLGLIPYINIVFSLVLLFKNGTGPVNRYGPVDRENGMIKRILNLN